MLIHSNCYGKLPVEAAVSGEEWIQFSDEDPRKGFVKGTIEVGPAAHLD